MVFIHISSAEGASVIRTEKIVKESIDQRLKELKQVCLERLSDSPCALHNPPSDDKTVERLDMQKQASETESYSSCSDEDYDGDSIVQPSPPDVVALDEGCFDDHKSAGKNDEPKVVAHKMSSNNENVSSFCNVTKRLSNSELLFDITKLANLLALTASLDSNEARHHSFLKDGDESLSVHSLDWWERPYWAWVWNEILLAESALFAKDLEVDQNVCITVSTNALVARLPFLTSSNNQRVLTVIDHKVDLKFIRHQVKQISGLTVDQITLDWLSDTFGLEKRDPQMADVAEMIKKQLTNLSDNSEKGLNFSKLNKSSTKLGASKQRSHHSCCKSGKSVTFAIGTPLDQPGNSSETGKVDDCEGLDSQQQLLQAKTDSNKATSAVRSRRPESSRPVTNPYKDVKSETKIVTRIRAERMESDSCYHPDERTLQPKKPKKPLVGDQPASCSNKVPPVDEKKVPVNPYRQRKDSVSKLLYPTETKLDCTHAPNNVGPSPIAVNLTKKRTIAEGSEVVAPRKADEKTEGKPSQLNRDQPETTTESDGEYCSADPSPPTEKHVGNHCIRVTEVPPIEIQVPLNHLLNPYRTQEKVDRCAEATTNAMQSEGTHQPDSTSSPSHAVKVLINIETITEVAQPEADLEAERKPFQETEFQVETGIKGDGVSPPDNPNSPLTEPAEMPPACANQLPPVETKCVVNPCRLPKEGLEERADAILAGMQQPDNNASSTPMTTEVTPHDADIKSRGNACYNAEMMQTTCTNTINCEAIVSKAALEAQQTLLTPEALSKQEPGACESNATSPAKTRSVLEPTGCQATKVTRDVGADLTYQEVGAGESSVGESSRSCLQVDYGTNATIEFNVRKIVNPYKKQDTSIRSLLNAQIEEDAKRPVSDTNKVNMSEVSMTDLPHGEDHQLQETNVILASSGKSTNDASGDTSNKVDEVNVVTPHLSRRVSNGFIDREARNVENPPAPSRSPQIDSQGMDLTFLSQLPANLRSEARLAFLVAAEPVDNATKQKKGALHKWMVEASTIPKVPRVSLSPAKRESKRKRKRTGIDSFFRPNIGW